MGRSANEDVGLAWERRIERQRRSGLSIAEFCSQEGVSPASFYAWRRRLRGADSSGPQSLFVPVELATPGIASGGLRMELPSGAVLSLPAEASVELVTAVIRTVLAEERPTC
jgi:transposase-like protein